MTIGYKAAFNYRCLNQRYAVGETYEMDEKPILCQRGFHYCKILNNIFLFYPMSWKTNVFEIEDLSEDTVVDKRFSPFPPMKSATNKIKIVREIYDPEIVEVIGLEHYWEERNASFYDEVRILTYKSVYGYWITKVYNEAKDPIFYVDSFGSMATYTDEYGENIAKEVISEKLKILYKNKNPVYVFNDTYRSASLIKRDHDLNFFKNGFQKEMFKTFGIK
jgi:hypothetical protein